MRARPSKRVPGWWGRKCLEFGDTLRRQAALEHARAKADAAELAEREAATFADQDTGSAAVPEPTTAT